MIKSIVRRLFEGEGHQEVFAFDDKFERDAKIQRSKVLSIKIKHIPLLLSGEHQEVPFLLLHLTKIFGEEAYKRVKTSRPDKIFLIHYYLDGVTHIYLPIGDDTEIQIIFNRSGNATGLIVRERNSVVRYTTIPTTDSRTKLITKEKMVKAVNKYLKKYGYKALY